MAAALPPASVGVRRSQVRENRVHWARPGRPFAHSVFSRPKWPSRYRYSYPYQILSAVTQKCAGAAGFAAAVPPASVGVRRSQVRENRVHWARPSRPFAHSVFSPPNGPPGTGTSCPTKSFRPLPKSARGRRVFAAALPPASVGVRRSQVRENRVHWARPSRPFAHSVFSPPNGPPGTGTRCTTKSFRPLPKSARGRRVSLRWCHPHRWG